MTVRKCFAYRNSCTGSDVKMLFLFLVILSILDYLPSSCRGENYDRDSRKLFGGYRITPSYCKASRAAKYNRGNTICMFNHECARRGGEVVGSCMDGFLFGACCQLKSDSQSHIPKGPGVVMTSYLDYPDEEAATDDYDDQLEAWHNSFKPVVTPGYRPSDRTTVETTTESVQAEIISEGLSHITNTLLSTPPKDNNYIYIKPKPDYYTHSTINHGGPETVLVHANGSIVDDIARPSDFHIQVSSIQTKPTVPSSTSTKASYNTVSTHKPVRPVFKPKPIKTTTENYVIVSTVTKESVRPELSSINSIIQMLNDSTPNIKESTPAFDSLETKSSPAPATASPPYSYQSSGHYVTLKPSHSNTFSTKKPLSTANSILNEDKVTKPYYFSPKPTKSPYQDIDAFNRYPTNPSEFGDTVTTFSYVSSTTTKPTVTTRKPPSTSYVTGTKPSKRPAIPSAPITHYASGPDTFSSVTPTVIVLNSIEPAPSTEKEPQYVEISQEPFKKPVSQIVVNNNIASTNNIYMGKPPVSHDKPSSPTIVITPKPGAVTTPYPIKPKPVSASVRPVPISTPLYDTDISPTTLRPELQTSPDDLINFPPVRNPLLNATGSNPAVFNSSVDLENELEILHELDITTPTWQEDEKLKEKMNLFVSKIVGSLQGTFQELHDIVILDRKPNITLTSTTQKPKKTPATTKRPSVTTKKPARITTTRRTTVKTTKKPTRLTTAVRKPTTTPAPTTTTTKKPVSTTKKSKPTKATTTTQATTSISDQADDVTTESYSDEDIDFTDRHLCGVRPLSRSGKIVGGKNAKFGDWPWQVLVRESTWLGLFTKNKCGGVLITNRFVTTAAHCQPGFLASLVAVFGENDISGEKEPLNPVSRNVRRVIVHRHYDAATFENDLALLELETPVKFDAHIVPICMPPDEADFTGRMATVTGWGRLKYGGGVPAVLQVVQVPVIDNNACQEMFQTAGHAKKILGSFICAGYANGQKDSCEGDSGGPLVLQRDDGKWQLVGTVSHGIKCAAPFLPGVYMRTTFYKPWLKSVTGVR